jgi:hypothetical protein
MNKEYCQLDEQLIVKGHIGKVGPAKREIEIGLAGQSTSRA